MVTSIRHSAKSAIAASLVFCFLLQSCVRREIVRPEFLLIDATRDITVYTVDKREIRFSGGEYKVIEKGNKQYIAGEGRQYNPKTNYYEILFDGEIAFDEIEHIEWRERTTIGVVGDVVFIGSLALISLLILFLTNIDFH